MDWVWSVSKRGNKTEIKDEVAIFCFTRDYGSSGLEENEMLGLGHSVSFLRLLYQYRRVVA